MRLLDSDEDFLFCKPPLMHSVSVGSSIGSCVSWYEREFSDAAAKFKSACRSFDKPEEAGLLYRLDNLTSGIVAFARTPEALAAARDAAVAKTYQAVSPLLVVSKA